MNPLWSDIQAQGENLHHVTEHLYGTERTRLLDAAHFIQPNKPILLIGIASAAYLCWPAQAALSRAGRVARVMNAADALYEEWEALREANVVINSRSGETGEIVKLANRLHEAGIPFLAITNEPESSLARKARHILWADTRKDDLVSINVVTGMMLTTLVWAAAVRGDLDDVHAAVQALPDAMQQTVTQAAEQAERIADTLGNSRPIYLLGRGASLGAAACGRLVLEEVARHPAVAMEAAEFRQGPNEVVDERFGGIVFIPEGKTTQLARLLATDIHKNGGKLVTVGQSQALQGLPGLAFELPAISHEMIPILEVTPVQVLAYKLAERQGITPGSVRYITKIIREEA
jgi:glutamine---fructose-6-phosphate transaminase (isomerizing)